MLSCGSGVRLRISAKTQPTTSPIAIPAAASAISETVAWPSENVPPTTAPTATR